MLCYHIVDVLTKAQDTKDYVISYSIENIRYTTPNYINVGDEVYFSSNGELLGTLISESENQGALSITPASEYFTNSSGEVVEAFYPNEESRVDAKGRLMCVGTYNEDGGFLLNGDTYIAAGQSINVYTEIVTFVINVTGIELYE